MDIFHWFALKSVPLVGNVTFRRLLQHFGTPDRVLRAPLEELQRIPGVSAAVAANIVAHDSTRFAEQECRLVAERGVSVVTFLDEAYPKLLLEIPDPPPYLYVRGDLGGGGMHLAVVGSRHASTYGLGATEKLSRELAEAGFTIVSGMARGVDGAAHRGALAGGGRTIGVLGCGVDVLYPREHRRLYDEIPEQGAIISEFPLGTEPLPENFPRRNRIITGMSKGVLVVEAAEKSGSLITAQFALDFGRDVFAIPGNINSPRSRGTNGLIKQGAKLVSSVEDILEEFPAAKGNGSVAPEVVFALTPQEAGVYSMLAAGPLHIDEIIVQSALTVGDLSAMLLRLELKGAIEQLPGKYFSIAG